MQIYHVTLSREHCSETFKVPHKRPWLRINNGNITIIHQSRKRDEKRISLKRIIHPICRVNPDTQTNNFTIFCTFKKYNFHKSFSCNFHIILTRVDPEQPFLAKNDPFLSPFLRKKHICSSNDRCLTRLQFGSF